MMVALECRGIVGETIDFQIQFFFTFKNFNHESWCKFCLDIHATSKKIRLNVLNR